MENTNIYIYICIYIYIYSIYKYILILIIKNKKNNILEMCKHLRGPRAGVTSKTFRSCQASGQAHGGTAPSDFHEILTGVSWLRLTAGLA